MSTETPNSTVPAVNEVAPMLTITQYQQAADHLRGELARVIAILPPLDPSVTASSVKAHLNVSRAFHETTIASVERHAELQGVSPLIPATAREALQYIDAFRAVVDDALAFASRVTLGIQVRQAELTRDTLQAYRVATAVSRHDRNPELTLSVASMKRDLGRRGPIRLPVAVRKAANEAARAARASVIAAATASAPVVEGKAA